jgi:hypothetical protein
VSVPLPDVTRRGALTGALVLALVGVGCAPRARPLTGAAVPQLHLPSSALPPGARRIVFQWEYREQEGFNAHGDGVARVVAPDSARLDFFVDGGFGGGWAILIGDALTVPGPDFVRRLIPPATMLWATLGRLTVPSAADTTARAVGDTLRADIGRDPTWRVTFIGPRLRRVERVEGGRIQEWVDRDGDQLRYQHETTKRSLTLRIQRTEETSGFDASIWRR